MRKVVNGGGGTVEVKTRMEFPSDSAVKTEGGWVSAGSEDGRRGGYWVSLAGN